MKPSFEANGDSIWYDPTPGGNKNADGSTTYGLRFKMMRMTDDVDDPDTVARLVAAVLNKHWPVLP